MTILRRTCEISGLLLLSRVGVSVPGVVLVLGIADTVIAVGFILSLHRVVRRNPASSDESVQVRSLLRRNLAYCTPLDGAQWTDVASHNLDKLVIGGLTSPAVFGFYSVARLASERLMLILAQAPQMAVPVVTQLEKAEDSQRAHRLIRRLLEYQWGFTLLGILVGWVMAPLFVLVVGGGEFIPAADGLRILLFACVDVVGDRHSARLFHGS